MTELSENPLVVMVGRLGIEAAAKKLKKSPHEIAESLQDLRGEADPEFFDTRFLKIRDKNGNLVPLKDNWGQRQIQESIDRQRKAGKPVRIKIAKARQWGGSTKTQAAMYRDARYGEHVSMLTVCHDMDSARHMRDIFERFHKHFPLAKPQLKKSGGEKMWKFPQQDIDILIDTADELDTGRSFTTHRLHCSEVAFYRDHAELMPGLLNSVPNTPNTVVVMESTANGLGGWWYDFVMGDNGYDLIFVPWFKIEEYTVPFASEDVRSDLEGTLSDYEKELMRSFFITLEQLNWRRTTLKTALNGDEDKFRQEYPTTLEESFIASGRPYFPQDAIRKHFLRTRGISAKRYSLEWVTAGEEVRMDEDVNGNWFIAHSPVKGWEYRCVGGYDPAEGKTADKSGKNPDYSAAAIYDKYAGEVTAIFKARVDTDIFENEIYKAIVLYNSCLDAVERNNTAGGAIIKGLKDKPKVNLYRKQVWDEAVEKETVEYGHRTDGTTREMILSELRRQIKDGTLRCDIHEFWKECLTFIKDKTGKPIHESGEHDDVVFAVALALEAARQSGEAVPPPTETVEEKAPGDIDHWAKLEEEVMDRASF